MKEIKTVLGAWRTHLHVLSSSEHLGILPAIGARWMRREAACSWTSVYPQHPPLPNIAAAEAHSILLSKGHNQMLIRVREVAFGQARRCDVRGVKVKPLLYLQWRLFSDNLDEGQGGTSLDKTLAIDLDNSPVGVPFIPLFLLIL